MNTDCQNGANKRLVLHMRIRCGLLSITTSVSILANELDVRSTLHGQVSLATVNHIYVIHEVMNSCKDSLKACFENINIRKWSICSFGANASFSIIFSKSIQNLT